MKTRKNDTASINSKQKQFEKEFDSTHFQDSGVFKQRISKRSFTLKVAIAFGVVAALTIIIAVGVLAVVWEGYFQSYTRENIQHLANSTAQQIALVYQRNKGDWYSGALNAASTASSLNESIAIQVVSSDGDIIYDDASRYDSIGDYRAIPSNSNAASASINVDGEEIGTVYVSVYGSDTLLTHTDEVFKSESYQAVLIASIVAICIALIIGFFFSRKLLRPINSIADAANEIKEGNYKARANVSDNDSAADEMARLAKTFNRMADSIEQSRQQERRLVTDVAHELRTPLMAVQSTVEAMIDGVFEPDEERLETLNSEIRRLSRLVNGLLRLSRLENRSNPIELTKVDISELVETIISTHEQYVEEAGLTLEFRHDPHIYVLGNADMLRQATANLISNAVRYTPEGGKITVVAKKGDIMGQISVQDTGIGLTPEEAKMVFSRFWRADKGRATDSGGLGIGLSVVKEIVDRHHGWVYVEGKPDEGSIFTIYIPLYREPNTTTKRRKGSLGSKSNNQNSE